MNFPLEYKITNLWFFLTNSEGKSIDQVNKLSYLNPSLVRSLPIVFATNMATQMKTQIIECYQFNYHFTIHQKR